VDSTPGQGSTFTVTVRLASTNAPVVAPAVTGAPVGRSLHVLVAEDNPVNQRVAQLLLERRGHRVELVTDGAEAVAAVHRTKFDLVLMDVQMPVLDGLAATEKIRAHPPAHGSPRIVALTANALVDDRTASRRAGMDGFLAKPIREAELDAVLAGAAARVDVNESLSYATEAESIRAWVDDMAAATGGDNNKLAEILHNYADRLPDVLRRMERAAADGDARNLARLAHGLKGSSATLGASRFAALCADVENRAHLGPLETLPNDLYEQAHEVGGVMQVISAELEGAARA